MAESKSKNTQKGKDAEDLATTFLIENQYQILERNFRFKRGEIDIICQKNNLMIFVEVKSRKSDFFGFPEEAVSHSKANLIKVTAEEYMIQKNWHQDIRIDIISITLGKIYHIKDGF